MVQEAILLVEDDAKLAQLVQGYLSQNGYAPTWVANGSEVAEQLATATFKLVILDVNLPGKNGFDICHAIRQQFRGPILMLTARSSDLDHIQGLELGADDYLCKPIEPLLLLARIRSHLNRYSR